MASIVTYYTDCRDFGFRYVWEYWIMGRFCGKQRKHAAVTQYLQRFFAKHPIDNAAQYAVSPNPYPDSIWVCWWQGEEQMPEVVKICYASLKAHANGHPVRLITKDNYREYIEMPEWVMEKFDAGKITITHFSDLLRVALLSRYGGFWMDATLYLTGDLPKETPLFFTLKQNAKDDAYVSAYRWSGYCMGGTSANPIFAQAYSMLVNGYWVKQERLVNYFILDYIYDLLYQSNDQIREMIDGNANNNPDVMFLAEHVNRSFNKAEWKHVCENTQIYKLSWKQKLCTETKDSKQTYFGYLSNSNEHS